MEMVDKENAKIQNKQEQEQGHKAATIRNPRKHFLPVKSSGYGRPAQSSNNRRRDPSDIKLRPMQKRGYDSDCNSSVGSSKSIVSKKKKPISQTPKRTSASSDAIAQPVPRSNLSSTPISWAQQQRQRQIRRRKVKVVEHGRKLLCESPSLVQEPSQEGRHGTLSVGKRNRSCFVGDEKRHRALEHSPERDNKVVKISSVSSPHKDHHQFTIVPAESCIADVKTNLQFKTPKKGDCATPSSISKYGFSSAILTPNTRAVVHAGNLGFDPSSSDVRKFAESIFHDKISTEEVKHLLKTRVAGQKWELKKRVEEFTMLNKRLKETLDLLQRGKDQLYAFSVKTEMGAKIGWARAAQKVDQLDREKKNLKEECIKKSSEAAELREKVKDMRRDVFQKDENATALDAELKPLREALAFAENARTRAELALAVAEGRSEEATKHAEKWREEIYAIEASKAKAVKDAEAAISATLEKELIGLRDERSRLVSKMESREEELGRLVNLAGLSEGGSQLDGVKREFDRLRARAGQLENQLESKSSELDSLHHQYQVSRIFGVMKNYRLLVFQFSYKIASPFESNKGYNRSCFIKGKRDE